MSPAYPAAWLIFGLIFVMATAHFLSLPWSRLATVVVYSIPVVWCLLILRDRIGMLRKLNAIDIGFAAFILVVLVSGFIFPSLDEHSSVSKYIRFLPFMMITPFILGRLMRFKDIELISRIVLFLGLALLPLLLVDRLTVTERSWRLPIFGLDHGPLMVGGLLAAALLALCSRVLTLDHQTETNGGLRRLVLLALIGCGTFALVGVMARGWLLAGLTAMVVVSLSMRDRSLVHRVGLSAYVFAIAMLTLFFLPVSTFYAAILSIPAPVSITTTEFESILGEASCQSFKDGVDSVAMRWVMYREAWAMFIQNPVWGVGVARFGDSSCTGAGWYPHNTILQGFAELGFIGGGLQIGLFILTASTLLQRVIYNPQFRIKAEYAFVVGLFVLFLVSDQFYGNYLMAAGTWLIVGIAASLRTNANEESSRA